MSASRANGMQGVVKTRHWAEVDMSTVLKIFAAFLGGLVIVMGGALLHSRAREFGHPVNGKPKLADRVTVSPSDSATAGQQPLGNAATSAHPQGTLAVTPAKHLTSDLAESKFPENPSVKSSSQPPQVAQAEDARATASNGWPAAPAQQHANLNSDPPLLSPPVAAASAAIQQPPTLDPHYATPEPPRYAAIEQTPPAQPQVTPEPKTKLITVQPGTRIAVRLNETLATDRNRTGDTFRGTLASPLVVNGFVVGESGAAVLGRVVNAHKAPVLGGRAVLNLTITNIESKAAGLVPVDTLTWEEKGAHSNIVNTAKMATGAAVGAVVGAVAGAAEGAGLISGVQERDRTDGFMATKRTVVLPAGTPIVFVTATPFAVTEKLDPR